MSAPAFGTARVLMADPPWPAKDRLPGKGRGAAKHYDLLSIDDIKAFPLPPLTDDAVLVLWRVDPNTGQAWRPTLDGKRLRVGMGRYVRMCHETAIIARRIGQGPPERAHLDVKSIVYAPRLEHSAKPAAAYKAIERLYRGPYVELFARRARERWHSYGDELWRPSPAG